MAAQKSEIIGTYLGHSQKWDETVLGKIDVEEGDGYVRLTIKGRDTTGTLQLHQRYRFYGRWSTYQNKHSRRNEKQFHFDSFVLSTPASKQGVVAYLKQLPGIALGIATKLWDTYGSQAVEILRTEPERVAREIPGVSAAKAAEAAEVLRESTRTERANMDILGLLAGRGFPRSIAPKVLQKFGNRAAELINRNPYLLMKFPGCGFKRADKMYLDLGLPPGKLKRQALCITKAAESEGDGHTWLPAGRVCSALDGAIGGAEPQHAKALYLARRSRHVDTRRDRQNQLWVADYQRSKDESFVAQRVAEMLCEGLPELWPDVDGILNVSDHQRERLKIATRGRLAILTGGPGTGKTHCLAALIDAIQNPDNTFPPTRKTGWGTPGPNIKICAPTGKAAVRMMNALAAHGHLFDATTIHSLLGVQSVDGGGWRFHHHATNPLTCQILIIDEVSMLGVPLAASLFAAIPKNCHVLLVGDISQLPPVEHGAVLRDLIAAGVPCGELTEPRRNSGTIVDCCSNIRQGKPAVIAPRIDLKAESPQNLFLGPAPTTAAQVDKLFHAIEISRVLDMDPVWDMQVLVPLNDKSEVSRKRLNGILQNWLNPEGRQVAGNPFRVGDKVINLKNGTYDPYRDKDSVGANVDPIVAPIKHFVANGDMGKVIDVGAKWTRIKLEYPDRDILVPHGAVEEPEDDEGEGDGQAEKEPKARWDLAYAVTVHKSQGSQWPIVVVMLDDHPSAKRLASRELAYTAISRAQKLCLLIGKRQTLDAMCRRQVLGSRKTFMSEILKEKITLQALSGI